MTQLVRHGYQVASGGTIAAGRFAGLAGDIGLAGDSLTDLLYNSCGSRVGFPQTMRPPRITFNAGWQAQTIKDLADRFQAVIDAHTNIATWVIRIGTNGHGGTSYQFQFGRLFTMLIASGKRGVFNSIPPRAGTAGVDNAFIAENLWLKAQCEADPGNLFYVGDSQELGDANYNIIVSTTVGDSIHMNGKGILAQGNRQYRRYSEIFAQVDSRIMDANDTYLSNASSDQWIRNPHMGGTGGSVSSGVTGVAPTNWSASGYGAGTGGVASIVSADANDPVQLPWFQLANLTSGGNTHTVSLVGLMTHPAVAADLAIKRLDCVAEVRLKGINMVATSNLAFGVDVSGTSVGIGHNINMTGDAVVTKQLVLRTSLPRTQQSSSGNSATLVAYAQNAMKLSLGLSFRAVQATPSGSIAIRCASVRGSST